MSQLINLREMGRQLRSRFVPHVAILGYHRVYADAEDPFDLSVTAEEFDAHLGFLAHHARIVSLSQAVSELSAGSIPRRTVVITFDDGYADTLTAALPLLQRYDLPATVFVATGNPGEPFWWDVLSSAVLAAPALPDPRRLEMDGAEQLSRLRDRTQYLRGVAKLLRPLDAASQRARINALLGSEARPPHAPPRALHREEIRRLAADPRIEIGGHSVTHPVLARFPREQQLEEIATNRRELQTLTGKPVPHFSYPNGSYSDVTCDVARQAGYTAAFTSVLDVATAASEPFTLPRLFVDGPRRRFFASWIRGWLP